MAIDRQHLVAMLQARATQRRGLSDIADHRTHLGHATGPQHAGQNEDREDEVEGRTSQEHSDTLPVRTLPEGPIHLVRRHRAVALVQQLDVAAERHHTQNVLGLVRTGNATPQRSPETD